MSATESDIKTLPALLKHSVDQFSVRPALGFAGEKSISFETLGEKVSQVTSYLKDNGVRPGDRVAILSENGPNWGIAFFSITSIRAVAVPILNEFNPAEIHHILRHSGARALFISERLYHKVEEFDLDGLDAVILIDNFSVISSPMSKDRLKRLYAQGSRELARIRHMALQKVGLAPMEVAEEETASIIYTSGTTGHSKGVMLSHGNIVSNARATAEVVSVGKRDRLLSILPLPHVYECTLGLILPVMIGASVSYVKKPPTAAVLLPALKQVRPTVMLSVPLIIEKMFKARILPEIRKSKLVKTAYKLPAVRKMIHRKAGRKLLETFGGELRTFCIGGAGVAPDVEKFMREAEFPYAMGYGLTETSPLVSGTDAPEARFRASGKIMPGVEVKIDEKYGEAGVGEILVKGQGVMKGYFNDPERTKDVFTDDGWFRTGDLGSCDKDGYLFIRGRLKNMILGPSGENIYPEAIESVINRSDYVLESLAYQLNNKLVARVHLNYEKIDEEIATKGLSQSETRDFIKKLLISLREETNSEVSSFSRLAEMIEQTEAFEKTPTQKIKRYLYISEN